VKIEVGCEEFNRDRPDINDRTQLSHAAGGGYEGEVKIPTRAGEISTPTSQIITEKNTPLIYR